ncbi:MAG: transglycosylase domain-containing protein, partial [Desulfobulbaceae bacterium]|nr:transglycosylase domain-containing protein [Desulfobulbaceae bacterium]
MLKRFFFYSVATASLACVVGAALFAWLVVFSPGAAIRQGNIKDILGVESPVYYNDGQSKIGVFFEKTHRQYIPFEQMPKRFVEAIVAAEDHDFFTHIGVDIPGMFRAMVANLRAGRVVQGGSTITQQAAKNLFKRKSRSVKAKLKELLYALRLE